MVLSSHDIEADEASIPRVAKAIAAQVQRASLTLAALTRSEPDGAPAPSPPRRQRPNLPRTWD